MHEKSIRTQVKENSLHYSQNIPLYKISVQGYGLEETFPFLANFPNKLLLKNRIQLATIQINNKK